MSALIPARRSPSFGTVWVFAPRFTPRGAALVSARLQLSSLLLPAWTHLCSNIPGILRNTPGCSTIRRLFRRCSISVLKANKAKHDAKYSLPKGLGANYLNSLPKGLEALGALVVLQSPLGKHLGAWFVEMKLSSLAFQ